MKTKGTTERPRLSVFRSNKYIYAQIIDDIQGKTLTAASETEIKKINPALAAQKSKINKTERAGIVGKILGEKAVNLKIKQVVFDRGCYKYNGRVKALAESVRQTGIKF